ncbi:helix-turn-helix protein [Microbacterium sp. BK668]|nr:helix-turn-helix protein [Microbacterium sp. BK668]
MLLADMDVQILTGQQVAEMLQVPPRTLEEWRQTHHGPPWRRVGTHVPYSHTEVLAWFEGLASHALAPAARRRAW